MLKAASNVNSNPNSPLAIAFKPRQVLLAEHRTKITAMSKKNHTKTQTLTQQQKTRLLYSVIKFIENNAFSKTLKRILSEAQIEGEEWKSVPLDLEDLYCNYLDICNRDETTANTIEKQDLHSEGTTKVDTNSHCVVSKEPLKKKKKEKKKKRSESEQLGAAVQSEAILIKVSDSTKNSKVSDARTNGKKKGKNGSDYSDESKETQSLANTVSVENGELTEKSKEKKEKKNKSKNVNQEDIDTVRVEVEEQSKDLASAVCDVKKEKKSSKKRKRLVSDDNEIQSDDNETSEECKWKKAKGSEKSEKNDKSKESEKENSQDKKGELTFTNKAQLSHADENHENGGDRSASKKSAKKQHNGSAEPKTVNAFQRVKIDEVEFADEKLQDNSYWAKSGAEIGYGAKAQEVLGQVRGRDFRHEKTKKKRGSYRGGLIDLQSHSVKFNYSDED